MVLQNAMHMIVFRSMSPIFLVQNINFMLHVIILLCTPTMVIVVFLLEVKKIEDAAYIENRSTVYL